MSDVNIPETLLKERKTIARETAKAVISFDASTFIPQPEHSPPVPFLSEVLAHTDMTYVIGSIEYNGEQTLCLKQEPTSDIPALYYICKHPTNPHMPALDLYDMYIQANDSQAISVKNLCPNPDQHTIQIKISKELTTRDFMKYDYEKRTVELGEIKHHEELRSIFHEAGHAWEFYLYEQLSSGKKIHYESSIRNVDSINEINYLESPDEAREMLKDIHQYIASSERMADIIGRRILNQLNQQITQPFLTIDTYKKEQIDTQSTYDIVYAPVIFTLIELIEKDSDDHVNMERIDPKKYFVCAENKTPQAIERMKESVKRIKEAKIKAERSITSALELYVSEQDPNFQDKLISTTDDTFLFLYDDFIEIAIIYNQGKRETLVINDNQITHIQVDKDGTIHEDQFSGSLQTDTYEADRQRLLDHCDRIIQLVESSFPVTEQHKTIKKLHAATDIYKQQWKQILQDAYNIADDEWFTRTDEENQGKTNPLIYNISDNTTLTSHSAGEDMYYFLTTIQGNQRITYKITPTAIIKKVEEKNDGVYEYISSDSTDQVNNDPERYINMYTTYINDIKKLMLSSIDA